MTENEELNIDDCLKELKKHRDVYLKRCTPWRIVNRAIRLIEQYRAIGTIEEFKALKEKNEPKKPYQDEHFQHTYFCSCCDYTLAESVDDDCCLEEEMAGWCPKCGQKLNWSE